MEISCASVFQIEELGLQIDVSVFVDLLLVCAMCLGNQRRSAHMLMAENAGISCKH